MSMDNVMLWAFLTVLIFKKLAIYLWRFMPNFNKLERITQQKLACFKLGPYEKQPLVKMSTTNSPGGKGGRCVRLTTYHHTVLLSRNLGALTSLDPSGPARPVTGVLYLSKYIMHLLVKIKKILIIIKMHGTTMKKMNMFIIFFVSMAYTRHCNWQN